jgi:hypothetical protein
MGVTDHASTMGHTMALRRSASLVVVTGIIMMCTPRTDGSAAGAAVERSRGVVLTSPLRVSGRRPDSAARALSMVVGSAHQIKHAFLFEHSRCRICAAGSSMVLFGTLLDQCARSFDRAYVFATFEFDAV